MTELLLIFGIGVLGLAFAGYLARWVVAHPAGEGDMPRVAGLIRVAAEGYFRRQTSAIAAVSAAFGGAIFLAYGLLRRDVAGGGVSALELGVWLTLSFAAGAAGAVATGRAATWIITRTNARAASGARRSLDLAMQVALRGGAVSGLFVVAMSLLTMAGLFSAVLVYKGAFGSEPAAALKLVPEIPLMIAGSALGAAFAALLAQLGGGTFSKAADIGADLGGRESGLPEDDAQNPATIADLAGDAVGDGAARSSGLFASTIAESLAAMIIAAALFRANASLPSALAVVLFPLVGRAFGILGTMFGVMVVKTDDREDPLSAIARGLYVTAALHLAGMAGAAKWLLGRHWPSFFSCGAIGIATAIGLFHLTQYFTEHTRRPVRELAEAARAGPALAILHGVAAGLQGALAPVGVVSVAMLGSYHLGARTGLGEGGLFGIAVATVGMLGMAGYVLAMDGFGPIVDAAGGIVEMTVARERPDVRGRTVVLDGVGNTVKAVTKAYAAGAAGLASLLMVAAYLEEVRRRVAGAGGAVPSAGIAVDRPEVYLGAVLGIALVLWFSSRCIVGVTRTARRVVDEVRRQLRGRAPIGAHRALGDAADEPSKAGRAGPTDRPLAGASALSSLAGASAVSKSPPSVPPPFVPDHEACVELVARAALRHMALPALVAAAAPVLLGLALRFAKTEDNPLLVADSVAALVLAGTIAGVLGSLLLGISGGALDNAKKYIVTGAHGGRYVVDETGTRTDSPAYASAAVSDNFADPLKDTLGPAIHVLVKMLPAVTIVFLPFFV